MYVFHICPSVNLSVSNSETTERISKCFIFGCEAEEYKARSLLSTQFILNSLRFPVLLTLYYPVITTCTSRSHITGLYASHKGIYVFLVDLYSNGSHFPTHPQVFFFYNRNREGLLHGTS